LKPKAEKADSGCFPIRQQEWRIQL